MSLITDLLIVVVFTVIMMITLWIFMYKMTDGESGSSKVNTMFALMMIGICMIAFLVWIFWR